MRKKECLEKKKRSLGDDNFEVLNTLSNVAVSQILPLRKFAYIDPETRDNIRHDAYFFSGANRAGGQTGWVDFISAYFSELPMLIDRGLSPADVVMSMASPMDTPPSAA